MLQEVKDLQNRAVLELLSEYNNRRETVFKSPTGSGKTYMMADFMNRVLQENQDIVFLVSSLSKGDLAEQNYQKFCEYSENGYFSNLNTYLINSETSVEGAIHIPTDYNVYVLPRDLYKKGARLMENGLEKFLTKLSFNRQFNGFGKTICLIKDECHIATNNIDNILDRYFTKKINISATPKRDQIPNVIITEEEAISASLIKRVEFGNDEEDYGVEVAINKFEEIKKDYRNLLGVNPCLIIQISNKEKGDAELQEILHVLEKIEHIDLRWMYIVDDEKKYRTNYDKAENSSRSFWKDMAKNKLSKIDVIIFKMVITEGWDIPRACMLYQTRKTRSEQLTKQVIGRVRRNPRLLDFETLSEDAKNLAMTAWIWGRVPEEELKSRTVKLCADGCEVQSEIRLKTTKLKTLKDKLDFDVDLFLQNRKKDITSPNIFQMYKKLIKADGDIQEMCYEYAKEDISKWIKFAENVEAIAKESNNFVCNYAQSMELTKDNKGNEIEVSMPAQSIYVDSNISIRIKDWVWNRKDGHINFSFDSDAERKWAEILQSLVALNNKESKAQRAIKSIVIGKRNPNAGQINFLGEVEQEKLEAEQKYLWGKNYLQNSEIKYDYYLEGLHSSYPDFIMKDSFDRIHLFEVKSINKSNKIKVDDAQYKAKIQELENCYLQASKLTGHIFYIPLLEKEVWKITMMHNGKKEMITEDQFMEFVVNKPNSIFQD